MINDLFLFTCRLFVFSNKSSTVFLNNLCIHITEGLFLVNRGAIFRYDPMFII
jgi:hypothetical protein